MKRIITAVVKWVSIILVSFVLYLAWKKYTYSRIYPELIEAIVVPINEECDTYSNIWEVKKVFGDTTHFLVNESIYFINSEIDYKEGVKTIFISGYVYREQRTKDYIGCSNVWLFKDEYVEVR